MTEENSMHPPVPSTFYLETAFRCRSSSPLPTHAVLPAAAGTSVASWFPRAWACLALNPIKHRKRLDSISWILELLDSCCGRCRITTADMTTWQCHRVAPYHIFNFMTPFRHDFLTFAVYCLICCLFFIVIFFLLGARSMDAVYSVIFSPRDKSV